QRMTGPLPRRLPRGATALPMASVDRDVADVKGSRIQLPLSAHQHDGRTHAAHRSYRHDSGWILAISKATRSWTHTLAEQLTVETGKSVLARTVSHSRSAASPDRPEPCKPAKRSVTTASVSAPDSGKIGRASCRERVWMSARCVEVRGQ